MRAAPKQKCPQCENPEQVFTPRWRPTDKEGVVEVFIRCTVCGWEHAIRKTTPKLEKLAKVLYRLQRRQTQYMTAHNGVPDVNIGNLVLNTQRAMDQERKLIP